VLCADSGYFEVTLDGGSPPPVGHDTNQQAASTETLRGLRRSGATLIPGHDPTAIAALPTGMQ